MKKVLSLFFGISMILNSKSQTVTAITTTNGMAPIPAFTLGKPAGLIFLNTNITKHLEFSPDVTFSLKDGKLWFSDVWLKYNFWLDSGKHWKATIGGDFPSYFGQPFTGRGGEQIDQILRYPTGQAKLQYTLKDTSTLTLDYWYTQSIEKGYGTKGSYLSISYGWTKALGKKFSFNSNPNFFYLQYSDGTKGFAGSVDATVSHGESGLFVTLQGLSPITVNNVKADWSFSLGIKRRLF